MAPRKPKQADAPQIRIPPYSREAEEAILGSLLLSPEKTTELVDSFRIAPEWFFIDKNRTIFEAIQKVSQANGEGFDAVMVIDQLQESGQLDAIGGTAEIERLGSNTLMASHTQHYAEILREKYTLRRIISAAEEAAGKCYEPDRTVGTILSESQQSMLDISEGNGSNALPAWNESLRETYQNIETMLGNTSGVNGLSTGFDALDERTKGLRNGEMIVLAARPSMGKTSLAMNICTAIALGSDCTGRKQLTGKPKMPVAIFSCEMSTGSLITRLLCAIAGISQSRLVEGQYMTENERTETTKKLADAAGILNNAPIYIDDTGGLDIADVRARARRMKKNHGIKFIMIDYLQLLNCREAADQGRQLETTRISAGIKAMAKELDVPVLVLSQLSRNSENRDKSGTPRMSDLRDSGSIEQDADVIMLLRRPCKYPGTKDSDIPDLAIVDVAKNRNGSVGEVPLTFIDYLTQFMNRETHKDLNPAG